MNLKVCLTKKTEEKEIVIMGLITCPHCFKQIYDGVETCPNCGGPISSETIAQGEKRLKEGIHAYVLQKEKSWFIASGVIGAIIAVFFCFLLLPNVSGVKEYFIATFMVVTYGVVFCGYIYSIFCAHLFFGMKRKGILRWFLFIYLIFMVTVLTVCIPGVLFFVRAIIKRVRKRPVFSEEFVIGRCC